MKKSIWMLPSMVVILVLSTYIEQALLRTADGMKKMFLFFLVMMVATIVVNAEIPDISELKLEELEKLRSRIEVEINVRFGVNGFPISKGNYRAGVDIEPGKYKVLCAGTADSDSIIVEIHSAEDPGRFGNEYSSMSK